MNNKYVVMGVSGCGKSSIGSQLAQTLNVPFFDGDDFHSKHNVAKMQSGQPLNDNDRYSWLHTLNDLVREKKELVLACSALKPEYRRQLKQGNPELTFIYLQGGFDTIWARHQKRENHYFSGRSMLVSQFETLVEPSKEEALIIDIRQTPQAIITTIITQLELN
ncbi:gluconokinase [Vibrio sp. RC27]